MNNFISTILLILCLLFLFILLPIFSKHATYLFYSYYISSMITYLYAYLSMYILSYYHHIPPYLFFHINSFFLFIFPSIHKPNYLPNFVLIQPSTYPIYPLFSQSYLITSLSSSTFVPICI